MEDTRLDHLPTATIVNLRRLVWLRSIGISGAITAVAVAWYGFGLRLAFTPIVAILIGLALFNLWTWRQLNNVCVVTHTKFFAQLFLDVVALTGLLYFSGGAANPFTVVFFLPLTICAMVLGRRYTWAMTGVSVFFYTLLIVVPVPSSELSQDPSHTIFGLHILGMWLGFVVVAGLIAYFVVDMGETLQDREKRLAYAREKALRDERVVALGTLAAGAAHELGTPLSTMAIIVNELQKDYAKETFQDLHDQAQILHSQIERCKKALHVISASAGTFRAESARMMNVVDYLNEVVDQLKQTRINVEVDMTLHGPKPTPNILAERTLTQALTNILNNAVDASRSRIKLNASWTDSAILIAVLDEGDGYDTLLSYSIGTVGQSNKQDGLGLGLFLAHATINRLGGTITFYKRKHRGVSTQIQLPLTPLQTEASA